MSRLHSSKSFLLSFLYDFSFLPLKVIKFLSQDVKCKGENLVSHYEFPANILSVVAALLLFLLRKWW